MVSIYTRDTRAIYGRESQVSNKTSLSECSLVQIVKARHATTFSALVVNSRDIYYLKC